MSIYEVNMANAVLDAENGRIKKNSPVSEVFSALVHGQRPEVDSKVLDKSVETIKEIASKAATGDPVARTEINTLVKYAVEPRLLQAIRLFGFMGSFKSIGFNETAVIRTRKYDSIDARFQANSSDVPFAAYSYKEYPIPTVTISSGFSVDYREIYTGNFDGTVAEGIGQVQTDMQNKAVYYVTSVLYEALKNATGIVHFAESDGITQTAVDEMLKVMRRYGRVNICGDYSVVSQLNDFSGYLTVGSNTIPYGADAVADEIRKTGLISYYKGAYVTELPNAINWNKLNSDGTEYDLYMPQGLLFFIPQGQLAPLQIVQRGGIQTMTGDDIVTRQHMTRFDLEIGAAVAEGMEDQIGLISDTNYEAPSI